MFYSTDNGFTWTEGYETPWELVLLNYAKINGKLIGYRYAQLFEITINENEFQAKELDNDGLEGKSITSVSKFDNKVYLTSLSGVFYKPVDEFFIEKEVEE